MTKKLRDKDRIIIEAPINFLRLPLAVALPKCFESLFCFIGETRLFLVYIIGTIDCFHGLSYFSTEIISQILLEMLWSNIKKIRKSQDYVLVQTSFELNQY
jgi:hypothetical protein